MKNIFTERFLNDMAKFVDWMLADSFIPFVDANNIITVFLITVVVGVLAVCVSPKLRKLFF